MRQLKILLLASLGLIVNLPVASADETITGQPSASALFEQRIMPIFNSPKPSSCIQCHLSAVDLKDYILPSHEKTFVALRDAGLINLENPDQSKILTLIAMGENDADALAKRIHAKMRQAEYEAFSEWIVASASDPKLRDLPPLDKEERAGPTKSDEVIEFTRKNRVLDSFVRNVWSQRMRCFPCHTPNELDPNNPQHQKPIERHAEFVAQYGQRMNIFRESPEATLRQLSNSSRKSSDDHLPLLNLENPAKSLLILKPTAKIPPKNAEGGFEKPSSAEPVTHMGGLKMHVNDQSYKAVLAWIEDYARVVGDRYESAADLPADNWYPTQHVVRLNNAPADWVPLRAVQFVVYHADGPAEAQPIAFTQGLVTPRKLVMGSLSLLAQSGTRAAEEWDAEGASLEPGKYIVKVYYDRESRLDEDPLAMLGAEDLAGQLEIDAAWKTGFRDAEPLDGSKLSP